VAALARTSTPGDAAGDTQEAVGPSGGPSELYAASGVRITETMSMLVARAVSSGDFRADAEPPDILRALVGLTYGTTSAGWRRTRIVSFIS
jgi:hypothetical protein